jgi:hypothetical protein
MKDKVQAAKDRVINPLIAYVYDHTKHGKVPVACVAALSPDHIGVCFSKEKLPFDKAFIRSQAIGRAAMRSTVPVPNRKITNHNDKRVDITFAVFDMVADIKDRADRYYK